eukprot:SAG22_NODE_142_length_17922_cov_10.990406_17_plen_186_part_00
MRSDRLDQIATGVLAPVSATAAAAAAAAPAVPNCPGIPAQMTVPTGKHAGKLCSAGFAAVRKEAGGSTAKWCAAVCPPAPDGALMGDVSWSERQRQAAVQCLANRTVWVRLMDLSALHLPCADRTTRLGLIKNVCHASGARQLGVAALGLHSRDDADERCRQARADGPWDERHPEEQGIGDTVIC